MTRLYFLLILLIVLGNGCVLSQAINQNKDLTPEQIEALDKAGQAVDLCFTVSGPPPSGSTTLLTRPKNAPKVQFGPDCKILLPRT